MTDISRRLRRLASTLSSKPGGKIITRLGTIASVTPGAAADGNAAVSVTVRGNTVPAPYLASYTPVHSDAVMVLLIDSSPLILGQVIGLPAF